MKKKSTTNYIRLGMQCVAMALCFTLNLHAQTAVPITGFNTDIIADGASPTNTFSSGSMPGISHPTIGVDGQGPAAYCFVDNTYQWEIFSILPTCGLPTTLTSLQTPTLTYNLQAANANNSFTIASNTYVGSVYPVSGSVSLVTAASYSKLYVLFESAVNTPFSGSALVNATVTFTDASTQTYTNINVENWFTNINSAYTNLQRARNFPPGDVNPCGTGPYLFEMPLTISAGNYSKMVQSISFSYVNALGTSSNTINYFHVLALGGKAVLPPPPSNDNPCGAINASGNSGHVANTSQIVSFDGGSLLFAGVSNTPTANPPAAPNLIYYTGSTAFATHLGVSEPVPTCGTPGPSPKSVWYKFKVPTFGAFDLVVRTGYTATTFNTILSAYTYNGGSCSNPLLTSLPGACTTTGTLSLSALSLSAYAGQYIYIQLMGDGITSPSGNYMLSIAAEAPVLSITAITTAGVTFSIPTVSGNTILKVYHRLVGHVGHTLYSAPNNTTNYNLTGLVSGNNYQVWVSYSNGAQTFFSPMATFVTTTGCSGPLAAPAEAAVVGHCAQRTISWPAHPLATAANAYRLYSWKPATTNFYIAALNTTSYTLGALALNTTYNAFYRVICNGGAQVNSAVVTYTTCAGAAKQENPVKEDFIIWHNGIQFVNPTIEDLSIMADGLDLSDGQLHLFSANGLTEAPANFNHTNNATTRNDVLFNIIPNPNAGQFTLQLNEHLNIDEHVSISIFNATGSRVVNLQVNKANNQNQIVLNMADYPEGVYIITLQNGQLSQTHKMVITK